MRNHQRQMEFKVLRLNKSPREWIWIESWVPQSTPAFRRVGSKDDCERVAREGGIKLGKRMWSWVEMSFKEDLEDALCQMLLREWEMSPGWGMWSPFATMTGAVLMAWWRQNHYWSELEIVWTEIYWRLSILSNNFVWREDVSWGLNWRRKWSQEMGFF